MLSEFIDSRLPKTFDKVTVPMPDLPDGIPDPYRSFTPRQRELFNLWYLNIQRWQEIPTRGNALWHMTYPNQIHGFKGPFLPSPTGRPNLTTDPEEMERLIRQKKLPKYNLDPNTPLMRISVHIPSPIFLGEPRLSNNRIDFRTAQEIPPEHYRSFELCVPGQDPLLLGETAFEAHMRLVQLEIVQEPMV